MAEISRAPSQAAIDIKENSQELSNFQELQSKEIAELSKIAGTFKVAARPSTNQKEKQLPTTYTGKQNPEFPRSKMIIRSRVEPKVFFANERTFLSWLNIAVLLTFTSLSLLALEYAANSDCDGLKIACRAGQIAGVVMAPLAFGMMAYALFMYRKRTFQILRREMVRIDDQCGPTVLTIMLIFIMALAYVLVLIGEFTHKN